VAYHEDVEGFRVNGFVHEGSAMTVETIPWPPDGKIMLTYEDYACLPDDGKTYEILEGELQVTPAPRPKHQDVSRNLGRALDQYVCHHNAGKMYYSPIDIVADPHNIVQPDIIFISADRLDIIGEKNVQGMPDLIIEILSPSTGRKDRILKLRVYASHGLKHYWIVDPDEQTLEALELEGQSFKVTTALTGEATFEPTLFPGLRIDLSKVWE